MTNNNPSDTTVITEINPTHETTFFTNSQVITLRTTSETITDKDIRCIIKACNLQKNGLVKGRYYPTLVWGTNNHLQRMEFTHLSPDAWNQRHQLKSQLTNICYQLMDKLD